MGQFIGLSVLLLVLYGIAAQSSRIHQPHKAFEAAYRQSFKNGVAHS